MFKTNKYNKWYTNIISTAKSKNRIKSLIAEKNSEMFKNTNKSEESLKKMKENNGRWVRTEEYKRLASIVQKERFKNTPGTFTGKKFTKEMTEKRNKTRKERGIKPVFTGKGTRWCTNGIIEKMCLLENVPDGFFLGRTKKKKGT